MAKVEAAENIVTIVEQNVEYRKIIYRSQDTLMMCMSIPAGGTVPPVVYPTSQQSIIVMSGFGYLQSGTNSVTLQNGVLAVVPRNMYHTIVNSGYQPLKFFVIYSPPC